MALVPLLMWGVTAGLVNFFAISATNSIMPDAAEVLLPKLPPMIELVKLNLLYAVELALGLLLIRFGLK